MKNKKIVGWVLSFLVAAFLIFGSAMGKFMDFDGKQQMLDHLGYTAETLRSIGFLEITLSVLFLIPKAEPFGALLLTAYLGGATATHVRVGDPFYFPIIVGVVMWVALLLRSPHLRQMCSKPESK